MSNRNSSSDGVLREVLRQALRPTGVPAAHSGPVDPAAHAGPLDSWSPEQWNEAFSFLFLAAPGSRHALLEHQDDLLWFVTAPALLAGTPAVTLRRNASRLPQELRPGGRDFASVDWAASVELNLVVQAKYVLTVVQCGQDSLAVVAQGNTAPGTYNNLLHSQSPRARQPGAAPSVADGGVGNGSALPGTFTVQRRVYASPMSADVNLEGEKAGRPPTTCYPEVSFAVDNFEAGFEDLILSRPGDCYCVMLHVHASTNSNNAAAAGATAATHVSERRATLFSAYVTRVQVADYLATRTATAPKPSLLNRLLGAPGGSSAAEQGAGRKERVVMSGPASVGRAEVLAAAVGLSAAPADKLPGRAPAALQMSLMWMSLPVHALARAVLEFACEAL